MNNAQLINEQDNLAKRLQITQKENHIDLQAVKAAIILSSVEYPSIAEVNDGYFSGLPIIVCETIAQSTLGNVPFKAARTFEDCKDWEN